MGNTTLPNPKTADPATAIPMAIGIPAEKTPTAPNLQQQKLASTATDVPSIPTSAETGSLQWRRYDLKVKVSPNANFADKELMAKYSEWFAELQEADPKAMLRPWYRSDSSLPYITQATSFPASFAPFKKYFNRAQPLSKGGYSYCTIFAGTSLTFEEIGDEMNWWLRQESHGWWERPVQAEKVATIGWLLYSTISMNTASLTPIIQDEIPFEIGLRYRSISGTKIGAIHVEVEKNSNTMPRTSSLTCTAPNRPILSTQEAFVCVLSQICLIS